MNKGTWTVYGLSYCESGPYKTDGIFYIGRTQHPLNIRLRGHVSAKNTYVGKHLRRLRSLDIDFYIIPLVEFPYKSTMHWVYGDNNSRETEKNFIKHFGKTQTLFNRMHNPCFTKSTQQPQLHQHQIKRF